MVRLVFHQPLRQTEGLLSSPLALMGVDPLVPDHTTIPPDGPVTLVIDSTGLKVYGAGEWHRDKHGVRGRRTWRKLHLVVDAATNTIVAATLTTTNDGDASQVAPPLDQTTGPIDSVMADGAYDGEPIYRIVAERDAGATVVIPPRATAVLSDAAETAPTQRDRHIQTIVERGRLGWQRQADYGKRSKAETAMARYKRILGGQLHARTLPGQQVEAAIGVAVLNRTIKVVSGFGASAPTLLHQHPFRATSCQNTMTAAKPLGSGRPRHCRGAMPWPGRADPQSKASERRGRRPARLVPATPARPQMAD